MNQPITPIPAADAQPPVPPVVADRHGVAESVNGVVTGTSSNGSLPPADAGHSEFPIINTRPKSSVRGRILVVEDELVTQKLVSHCLADAQYEVFVANHGSEALEVLNNQSIELVLMDINMPVLDGLRTLRFIRQLQDVSTLPVIMMTSDVSSEGIKSCFDDGANDYVRKPIQPTELLARIESQLNLARAKGELLRSEQRYSLATEGSRDGIWDWDLRTGELYLSPRWRSLVGEDNLPETSKGSTWLDVIYPEDRDRVRAELESHLCGETSHFETELRMPDTDNGFRWMLCCGLAVRDANGIPVRIAGSLSDITEGKVADALTRLPNRLLFRDRIARCIDLYQRSPGRCFSILYIDVNDFKLINDSLGHDAGDQFLIEIAQRLEGSLRKSDAILSRLGGDEFGVLLENIHDVEDAIRVGQRILEHLEPPIFLGQNEVQAQVAIGIATMGPLVTSVDELIRHADTAMYDAKKQVPNSRIRVFDEQLRSDSAIRLEISSELKNVVRRDELSLAFQPIIDAHSLVTKGFEALVRWNHPVYGNISPGEFIPIAESNGRIIEIGQWVLEKACRQLSQWNRTYERKLLVSVNVSIRQFGVDGFVDQVCSVVTNNGIDPSQLKLEVTESLLMQNPNEMVEHFNQLKSFGILTSIDDFGTGYSSLAYLHLIPLNVLKIDRSFVDELTRCPKHEAIVRTVIGLARSLELDIIAEGIETKEQAIKLRELGCDYFQGYYFSKPVESELATKLINTSWDKIDTDSLS